MILTGNRKILMRAYFAYVQATFLRALATLPVASSEHIQSGEWFTTPMRYLWKLLSLPLTITVLPNNTYYTVMYILSKYTETGNIWYPHQTINDLLEYSTDLYGWIL